MVDKKIEIDLRIIASAVSGVGCCSCITSFLSEIPIDEAAEIACWINENEPLYGGYERIVFADDRWRTEVWDIKNPLPN